MSNILDKPLESVFGYITVLPGAFSAYRWHALQNDSVGNGPLKEYFKGETLESAVDADLLTKNMYLAEGTIVQRRSAGQKLMICNCRSRTVLGAGLKATIALDPTVCP